MPLLVRVETENGSPIAEFSDLEDSITALAEGQGAAGLVLAATIDPWGNTTFNSLQIPILLKEIEELVPRATAEEGRSLAEISELGRLALTEPHLYLKFYGD